MERRRSPRPSPDQLRGSRRRGPDTPSAPREPIGVERARSGAPARRERSAPRQPTVERPELPTDHRLELPPSVRKEIERRVAPRGRARDVLTCLDLGTAASERGDDQEGLRFLRWAKEQAPRVALVREALGIALYRAGEFRSALTELQAYRRLAGTTDQNHLIADCLRAVGGAPDEIVAVASELVEDERAEEARRIEAAIVAAAVLAESGRTGRARAVLGDAAGLVDRAGPEAAARRLWVAAELAEQDGDRGSALQLLEELHAIAPDPEVRAWRERLSRAE